MRCTNCGAPRRQAGSAFCGRACEWKWKQTQSLAPFDCPECKRTVLIPRKKLKDRKFCSLSCARAAYNREHLRGERNGRWRGGKAMSYGPEWKPIRKLVRERDKVCQECGKTPAENRRRLDVHHLDAFRIFGEHNPERMRALCRSCHMKEPDLGRAESAKFLRAHAQPRPPTRRMIRELKAFLRNVERKTARRELQAIALHLHAMGFSLRQIACDLDVSHQTIANWIKGEYIVEDGEQEEDGVA